MANSTSKDSEINEELDEEFATLLNQLRDDVEDITVEDFVTFDDNVTTSPGQINTDLVAWLEKALEEGIEDFVPKDLNSNEGQNPEVISDDEDHDDRLQASQHLDKLLEFSIAKNDETLSGLLSEVINAVENIKIPSLRQRNILSLFEKS